MGIWIIKALYYSYIQENICLWFLTLYVTTEKGANSWQIKLVKIPNIKKSNDNNN